MDRYPQCRSCENANWRRLGKTKCKVDNKPIASPTMVFGICKRYKPEKSCNQT